MTSAFWPLPTPNAHRRSAGLPAVVGADCLLPIAYFCYHSPNEDFFPFEAGAGAFGWFVTERKDSFPCIFDSGVTPCFQIHYHLSILT